ncbi:MAG: FtsW/RodA/SpoVE family cell cycle protein, partial [Acetatifactor sp.]|nr:FtsW/RodA/SpoVE family cell cycle protein [Acetatifactor sp.]
MFNKGYRIRNYDFKLILLILALSTIGVFAVGSAQQSVQQKQLMGVIMGTFLMLVISLLDYTVLLKLYWLMYLGNLVLLLLVRFFGEETKGAERWFQIPGGFRFQPSETAKILLILFFAQFIMKHVEKFNTFRIISLCIFLVAVPWYLIYKQPDLSTSIVVLALFCIIMFAGGLSFKVIFGVLAVSIPALALLGALALQPDSEVLTYNQRGRILAFIYPDQYATTTAYQQLNSVTAIASGMLDGKGYKNNEITSVKNGNFISEAQTDFIFAVIGEEFGFKGSLAVILLEMLIALECIHVARRARDPAGSIIAASMGGLVGVQAFINIGVATFILPTTG